jgi:GGDEF domain-containing protein
VFFRLKLDVSDEEQCNQVLADFAEKLLRSFQPQDLIARSGQSEYAALIGNTTQAEVERKANYLKRAFEEHGVEFGGQVLHARVEAVVVEALPLTRHYDDLQQLAERRRALEAAG